MEITRSRIIIIGAGVAGIAAGAMLRRRGVEDFLIVDRGTTFGGAWRDNIYPGVECDVQSHLYSYSFRPNPRWSKTYAPGSEILDYLSRVAAEQDLNRHAVFGQSVKDVRWDDESRTWTVTADDRKFVADFVITATGTLSEAKLPDIPGLADFKGNITHSAQWNPDLDLSGRRVAVVGTGASAIQVVPAIADQVEHLTVFQRTPPWVGPRMDVPYTPGQARMWEELPETLDEYRQFLFWLQEARFPERIKVQEAIDRMTAIADNHRLAQLTDPHLQEATRPSYSIGCKRILISNRWYPTLEKDNVTLVPQAAVSLTADGIVDASGQEHPVDTVIFCSGFDTEGSPVSRIIHGPQGERLADAWRDGPSAYGGMTVHGYPNLFVVGGPNVGLGFGSMFFMLETQAEYVAQVLETATAEDLGQLEVRPERQQEFADSVDARAAHTVWLTGGCDSFYLADGSGRLTSLWPDFMSRYRQQFELFDREDFLVH